jgi:hypothetical protein
MQLDAHRNGRLASDDEHEATRRHRMENGARPVDQFADIRLFRHHDPFGRGLDASSDHKAQIPVKAPGT